MCNAVCELRVKPVEERDARVGTPVATPTAPSPAHTSGSGLKGGLRKSLSGSGGHIRLDMGANIVAGRVTDRNSVLFTTLFCTPEHPLSFVVVANFLWSRV